MTSLMRRSRPTRSAALAVIVLAAMVSVRPAAAQAARLALHEAERMTVGEPADGRELVELPGDWPVYLGGVLLELGPGSIATVGLAPERFVDAVAVRLRLAPAEAEALGRISGDRIGEPLAVVLDGRALAAPTVRSAIPNGSLEISGLAVAEALALADALVEASGARPSAEVAAERRAAFRDSVDASTPAAAARSVLRAMELDDPATLVGLLHPALLADPSIADGAAALDIGGDSVAVPARWRRGLPVGLVAEASGDSLRRVALRDLLEREPRRDAGGALTAEDRAAVGMILDGGALDPVGRMEVVAVAQAGDGRAYAVVEPEPSEGREPEAVPEGASAARVLPFVRIGDGWRMLRPADP